MTDQANIEDGGTVDLDIAQTARGSIAHLRLNHPERRNAIGPAVIAALTARAQDLAMREDVRMVVLRGTAGIFAAGANVKVMRSLDSDGARAFISSLHASIDAVRNLPMPVIAVLEGHCYGAAMELAAACDMRLASADLQSGMPEVRVGIPSVIEACLLPRLIGWGRTSELLLTGRSIDAEEARAIGFVERVAEPGRIDAALQGWVDDILASAPAAVRAQKAVMRGWEQDDRSGIAASIDAFAAAYLTGEPTAYMAPRPKD